MKTNENVRKPMFKLTRSPSVWVWDEYRYENAPGGLPCPDDIHERAYFYDCSHVVEKLRPYTTEKLRLVALCIFDTDVKNSNPNVSNNENLKALKNHLQCDLPDTFIETCEAKRADFIRNQGLGTFQELQKSCGVIR